MVKQNKEGQKRSYVQLTLTGSKIAEKRLTETYGKEKNRLQPTDIAWWSMTTSNRNSSRSWTTTSRPTSKRVRPHRRRRDHLNSMIDDFYGPFHKMVDHATTTQTTKNNQIRILAPTPLRAYGKSPHRPLRSDVEIEGNEGKRAVSHHSRRAVDRIAHPRRALALFSLPATWALRREDLVIGIGKFGPYVRTANRSHRSPARTIPIRSATTALRSSCANSRPAPLQRTLRSKPSPKSPNY